MSGQGATAGDPARSRVQAALEGVAAALPFLAGLVQTTRVGLDVRVQTAGVFESGRVVISPEFMARTSDADLVFVLAHELLHLVLRTHARGQGHDRLMNAAHDAVINAQLEAALGRPAPAGVFLVQGAGLRSAEAVALHLRKNGGAPKDQGDVLDAETEQRWFPDQVTRERWQPHAAPAGVGLELGGSDWLRVVEGAPEDVALGRVTARRTPVRLEGSADGLLQDAGEAARRTYHRASRRGGGRTDVVLAGRRRDSPPLNAVVSTCGAMIPLLGIALGAVTAAAEASGAGEVRLLQVDEQFRREEVVQVGALGRHEFPASVMDEVKCRTCSRRCIGSPGTPHDVGPALADFARQAEGGPIVVVGTRSIRASVRPPAEVFWIILGWQDRFRPPFGTQLRVRR